MKTTFKQTPRKTVESNVIQDSAKRKRLVKEVNNFVNRKKKPHYVAATAIPSKTSAFLGNEVKTLRDSMGMSVRDFAKLIGIQYPNLCYIEQGKAKCRLSTLEKIAESTGKSVEIRFV